MKYRVQHSAIGFSCKNRIGTDEKGSDFCRNLGNNIDNEFYCVENEDCKACKATNYSAQSEVCLTLRFQNPS